MHSEMMFLNAANRCGGFSDFFGSRRLFDTIKVNKTENVDFPQGYKLAQSQGRICEVINRSNLVH